MVPENKTKHNGKWYEWSNDQVLLHSGHGNNSSFFYVFTILQQGGSPQISWADHVANSSTLKVCKVRKCLACGLGHYIYLYLGLFTLCMSCQAVWPNISTNLNCICGSLHLWLECFAPTWLSCRWALLNGLAKPSRGSRKVNSSIVCDLFPSTFSW